MTLIEFIEAKIVALKAYKQGRVTFLWIIPTEKLHSKKTNNHKDGQVDDLIRLLESLKKELNGKVTETAFIFNFLFRLQSLIDKELKFEFGNNLDLCTLLRRMLELEEFFMERLLDNLAYNEFISMHDMVFARINSKIMERYGHPYALVRWPIDHAPEKYRAILSKKALEEIKQHDQSIQPSAETYANICAQYFKTYGIKKEFFDFLSFVNKKNEKVGKKLEEYHKANSKDGTILELGEFKKEEMKSGMRLGS